MASDCFGVGAWSPFHADPAAQMPLSSDSDFFSAIADGGFAYPFLHAEGAASLSASDAEMVPKPAWSPAISPTARKITKRKSRAAKRSTTTYITADISNFKQMVQQVTGVQFVGRRETAEAAYKPEPRMSAGAGAALHGSCLPTLDTSSFLLEGAAASSPSQGSSFGSPAMDGSGAAAFDLDPPPSSSFHCFPTLESWRVM